MCMFTIRFDIITEYYMLYYNITEVVIRNRQNVLTGLTCSSAYRHDFHAWHAYFQFPIHQPFSESLKDENENYWDVLSVRKFCLSNTLFVSVVDELGVPIFRCPKAYPCTRFYCRIRTRRGTAAEWREVKDSDGIRSMFLVASLIM